jgi:hypothetical protein
LGNQNLGKLQSEIIVCHTTAASLESVMHSLTPSLCRSDLSGTVLRRRIWHTRRRLRSALALVVGLCALVAAAPGAFASPTIPDYAWQMTPYHPGYYFRPVGAGKASRGDVILFEVQVKKGIDYVILAGRDPDIQDLDLLAYDEKGVLLADDRRPLSHAAIRFRPNYTGTASIFVVIKRAKYEGEYQVIQGIRGEEGRSSPFKEPVEPSDPNGSKGFDPPPPTVDIKIPDPKELNKPEGKSVPDPKELRKPQ